MRSRLSRGTSYLWEVGGGGWGAPRREDAKKKDEGIVAGAMTMRCRTLKRCLPGSKPKKDRGDLGMLKAGRVVVGAV